MQARAVILSAALVVGLGTACKNDRWGKRTEAPGDELHAFIIKNCETQKSYCQVCAYSGRPTLMAVGSAEDEAFESDLVRIERLVHEAKAKDLTAFAVLGRIAGDKLLPFEDEEEAAKKLAAMKARLGLSFPVVMLPAKVSESQRKRYAGFNDAYALKGSRTIYLAKPDNQVIFAERIQPASAQTQFERLESTVGTL